MVLRTENRIETGAYADVFRPPDDTLVYKLFISGHHPRNVSQNLSRPEDDDRDEGLFCQNVKPMDVRHAILSCATIFRGSSASVRLTVSASPAEA